MNAMITELGPIRSTPTLVFVFISGEDRSEMSILGFIVVHNGNSVKPLEKTTGKKSVKQKYSDLD